VDYHQEAHEILEALNDASPLLEKRQAEKIKGYKTFIRWKHENQPSPDDKSLD
jgi:hypothetical protein